MCTKPINFFLLEFIFSFFFCITKDGNYNNSETVVDGGERRKIQTSYDNCSNNKQKFSNSRFD